MEQDFRESDQDDSQLSSINFLRRNPLTKEPVGGEFVSTQIKEYFQDLQAALGEKPYIPSEEELQDLEGLALQVSNWMSRFSKVEPSIKALPLENMVRSYVYSLIEEVRRVEGLEEVEKVAAIAGYLALIALVQKRVDPLGSLLSPDIELGVSLGEYSQEVYLSPTNPHKETIAVEHQAPVDPDFEIQIQPYYPIVQIKAEPALVKYGDGVGTWRSSPVYGIPAEDLRVRGSQVPSNWTGYVWEQDSSSGQWRFVWEYEGGEEVRLLNTKADQKSDNIFSFSPTPNYTVTAPLEPNQVPEENTYRPYYLVVEKALKRGGVEYDVAHLLRDLRDDFRTFQEPPEYTNEVFELQARASSDLGAPAEWKQIEGPDRVVTDTGDLLYQYERVGGTGSWYVTMDIEGSAHMRIPFDSPSYVFTSQIKDWRVFTQRDDGPLIYSPTDALRQEINEDAGGLDLIRTFTRVIPAPLSGLKYFLMTDDVSEDFKTPYIQGIKGSAASIALFIENTAGEVGKYIIEESVLGAARLDKVVDEDVQVVEWGALPELPELTGWSYPFREGDVLIPADPQKQELINVVTVGEVKPGAHNWQYQAGHDAGAFSSGAIVAPRGKSFLQILDQEYRPIDIDQKAFELEVETGSSGITVVVTSEDLSSRLEWVGTSLFETQEEVWSLVRGELRFGLEEPTKGRMDCEVELDPEGFIDLSGYENTTAFGLRTGKVTYIEEIGPEIETEDYRRVFGVRGELVDLKGPLSWGGHDSYGPYGRLKWYIDERFYSSWESLADTVRAAKYLRVAYQYEPITAEEVVEAVTGPEATLGAGNRTYPDRALEGATVFYRGVLQLNERNRPLRVVSVGRDTAGRLVLKLTGAPKEALPQGAVVTLSDSPIREAYRAAKAAEDACKKVVEAVKTLPSVSKWYTDLVQQAAGGNKVEEAGAFFEAELMGLLSSMQQEEGRTPLDELLEELVRGSE